MASYNTPAILHSFAVSTEMLPILFLSACAMVYGQEPTPSEVVQSFETHIFKNELTAAGELLCLETRASIDWKMKGPSMLALPPAVLEQMGPGVNVNIISETIDSSGYAAKVEFQVVSADTKSKSSSTASLVKEDGHWRMAPSRK